ncbi:hypothetical protein QBC33DRAFT_348222 [Phialemonium atrogriseum]|uniref:Secreted protein n=1 Tax=Phialemonium atrogriseum TaxID=1093897 RepID=A0AAJ0FNF6_9PEZI|nr:uncharacterized protein QBC33DRAFT_348222 [Phialemonium atrogriseum]KAK1769243.1 hypothetical protein QBC33DRAFT_348222 [Phialemonium atrogriseum]
MLWMASAPSFSPSHLFMMTIVLANTRLAMAFGRQPAIMTLNRRDAYGRGLLVEFCRHYTYVFLRDRRTARSYDDCILSGLLPSLTCSLLGFGAWETTIHENDQRYFLPRWGILVIKQHPHCNNKAYCILCVLARNLDEIDETKHLLSQRFLNPQFPIETGVQTDAAAHSART